MKSMTGYAQKEHHFDDAIISVEIKSYNSRYLDLYINLPFWMSGLEPFVRNFFSQRITRGKVEVAIKVKSLGADFTVEANTAVAEMYATAMMKIAKTLDLDTKPTLSDIIRQEGVLQAERPFDANDWQEKLTPLFNEVYYAYDETKQTEGDRIKTDIEKMIKQIQSAVAHIKMVSPKMEQIFKHNIKSKFEELLNENYDETRVLQETAALLVKYTINEEIVRLNAHLLAINDEIKKDGPIGKRMDFICQEINREINTIGSKNQMAEIAQDIIYTKDALENIREQMRNIE